MIAFSLSACAAPSAPKLSAQSPTIVSLNPCTDAILAEVAEPGQLLAISSYSQNPASSSMDLATAKRFAATGGTVEEILALHPDLVIDGSFTAPATKAALAKLGLRLEQMPIASTVEASKAQVRQLAALAGHPERGNRLIARINAALAGAMPPSTPPVPAVIWQSGGIVAGGGTLISDLLTRTGFTNAAAARGLSQASFLPLEDMIDRPPRVILAAGDQRANEDRLLSHPALAVLKGTRRERFDPALLWCGGPTISKAVARLAEVRRSL